MNPQPFGSTQACTEQRRSDKLDTHTQLRGPWLTIARAIWFALVVLALATWSAGVSPRFNELRVPCTGDECAYVTLSPQEADALRDIGLSLEFYAGYQVGFETFSVVMHALLAGVIFWRRSTDRMGLLVPLTLVLLGTFMFSYNSAALVKLYPDLHLLYISMTSLVVVSFALLLYLFPDGRFVPRWTRLLAVVLAVGMLPATLLSDDRMFYILFLGGLSTGLFAQVYRYRRVSGPVQRQQTKWVVFGLSALILVIFTWSLVGETFPLPPGLARLYLNLGAMGVFYPVIVLFPLSLTIAILRYRLWDIDVLINRTLVYGVLTGALALVYFGSVVLLQGLFRALTGQESQLAVVASTLAIAALFASLRRRIQDAIDRRFYRRKYDAEQVLAEFAEVARDEVDLDQLTTEVLWVVEETMQPEFVSLWLREPGVKREGRERMKYERQDSGSVRQGEHRE